MKKFLSFFAALLFAGSMMADSYVKVTAAPENWAGDYLIVYEAGSVAFNGALEVLDAVENTVAVAIADGAIEATDAMNAAKFTIAAMEGGYSIQAASGKYISQTSYANGLKSLDVAAANALSIDADGNAVITVTTEGGDVTLRFNAASNQLRFRYYKSGQQPVALYKLDGEVTPPAPKPVYYVAGSMNGWAANEAYKLAENKANAGEYMGEFTFAANDELKVIGVLDSTTTWYPDNAGNYKVADSADYTLYFRPEGGVEGWYEGYIYLQKKEPVQPITCLDVYQMAKNDVVDLLNDVVVTYANGKNVWVKDASASMLIYLSANTTWAAGDVLSGIAGVVDVYNGVHEIKPTADQVAAVTATPGEAPEAIELAVVEVADVNKYIVMKGVEAEGTFAEGTASNITINGVTVRNQFKNGYVFEAGKKYDVYGVVTIYQNNPQVYFIKAEEAGDTPAEETVVYDWAGQIGSTLYGVGTGADVVKIHTNTDAVDAIKFGNSYAYADGKYIAIKPAEGGFKAGDVLSVAVVLSNTDTITKYAQVDLRAANGDTRIWLSDSASTINGRMSAAEPIVQTYTLEADQDSLLLGRYGNTAMFITLLKVAREGGEVPPVPADKYYVIGSMTDWNVNEAYELIPSNDNEYKGEFTFAANDAFKVVKNDKEAWYPDGMGNDFVINEAGDYTITFNPAGNVEGWYAGFFNVVKKEEPIYPTYDVAEAIAAQPVDSTEMFVRGVITKMQIKGKNFAKYGSVCIYVADATGAEGEFEFYNCFSFNADTFRTTTPAYDATSTSWADLKMVADEYGNEVRLGDTIVAFGKYKLYNGVHELLQGCYITDLKPAPVPAGDTITLQWVSTSATVVYNDYCESDGWWQIQAQDDNYYITLSNAGSIASAPGTYTVADLDPSYSMIIEIATEKIISFVDGSVTLSVDEESNVFFEGQFLGDDNNTYVITIIYAAGSGDDKYKYDEDTDFIVNFDSYEIDDYYLADYGSINVIGQDENGNYLNLEVTLAEGSTKLEAGTYAIDVDYLPQTVHAGYYEGGYLYPSFAAVLGATGISKVWYLVSGSIVVAENGDVTVEAKNSLGHDIKVTLKGSPEEAVENVQAEGKAVKALKNGILVIEKNGAKFNVLGEVIR